MAKASNPRETPMMQQYFKIKAQQPNAFLFYRMGDFYELFDTDAIEASRLLGITLTSRNKGEDAVPMAGIPVHALTDYLKKLTSTGKRVAICEQLEEPSKGKKLVDRGVVRVITPGTMTENLDADQSSKLLSIVPGAEAIYLSWCDISTGQVAIRECLPHELTEVLVGLTIAECVYPEGRELPEGPFNNALVRPGWHFHAKEGKQLFSEIYGSGQLHFVDELSHGLWASLGGLYTYLKETQLEQLGHLRLPDIQGSESTLKMDANTLSSLDLLINHRTQEKGFTLFWVLNKCHTAGGRRELQQWIAHPLFNHADIEGRQEVFDLLMREPNVVDEMHETLQGVYDIERLLSRLSLGRGTPRDVASLGKSLSILSDIQDKWCASWSSPILNALKSTLEPLPELCQKIETYLSEDLPINLSEGGVIATGVDEVLDDFRHARSKAHQWLAEYQAKEVSETGLGKLRVIHNKVFGYSIELPRSAADKVPEHFKRQQTLKNVERYVTVELKQFESKVLSAREKSIGREKEIYEELLADLLTHLQEIQNKSQALSIFDVYLSLSRVSLSSNYVLPELVEGKALHVKEGRHPVVEKSIDSQSFIANDLDLHNTQTLLLITGPNMSGKSTYIRQIALIVVMAQMGMPVPAKKMQWSPVDRLYTRIGAADELAKGQSTFMVEMSECAHILRASTDKSLLIMDEIGRGTSTLDGLAIAQAIVEHLGRVLPARTLFATHYHELTNLSSDFPHISNANVLVKEWGDEIVFLHQVVAGATDRSYGIHVARLAGVPDSILNRADNLLDTLKPEKPLRELQVGAEIQMDLFGQANSKVLEHLATLNLNEVTPFQALQLLSDLQEDLKK